MPAAVGAGVPVADEDTGPRAAGRTVQPVRGDVADQTDHPRPRVRADHPVAVLLLDQGDLAEQHPDGVLELTRPSGS